MPCIVVDLALDRRSGCLLLSGQQRVGGDAEATLALSVSVDALLAIAAFTAVRRAWLSLPDVIGKAIANKGAEAPLVFGW